MSYWMLLLALSACRAGSNEPTLDSSPDSAGTAPKTVLVERDFSDLSGWALVSLPDPRIDTTYGAPPNSATCGGGGNCSVRSTPFIFDDETLDVRLDVDMLAFATDYSELILEILAQDGNADRTLVNVVYRSSGDNTKVQTLGGRCAFEPFVFSDDFNPVAVFADGLFHELHVVIDEQGGRCGVDGVDLRTDPTMTSVSGALAVRIRASDLAGHVWFDNFKLSKGTAP